MTSTNTSKKQSKKQKAMQEAFKVAYLDNAFSMLEEEVELECAISGLDSFWEYLHSGMDIAELFKDFLDICSDDNLPSDKFDFDDAYERVMSDWTDELKERLVDIINEELK